MKFEGIDHAAFLVKDIELAVETFSKLFETEFEEVMPAAPGMVPERRHFMNRPEANIELVQIIDPARMMESDPESAGIAQLAASGFEGPVLVVLKVKDADAATAEFDAKGVRSLKSFDIGAGGLLPFIPHFKKVLLNGEDTHVAGLGFMQRIAE